MRDISSNAANAVEQIHTLLSLVDKLDCDQPLLFQKGMLQAEHQEPVNSWIIRGKIRDLKTATGIQVLLRRRPKRQEESRPRPQNLTPEL